MARINLSRVILSTTLADKVSVIRRVQLIGETGRVLKDYAQRVFPRVGGVVTMAGPDDLDRLEDHQRMGRVISFVTTFGVQGPATLVGKQWSPDYLVWQGDTYLTLNVDPYPQFGPGFVQVLAGSIDSVDLPPLFNARAVGGFEFNKAKNALWAYILTGSQLAPPPPAPTGNLGALNFQFTPNGLWTVPLTQ